MTPEHNNGGRAVKAKLTTLFLPAPLKRVLGYNFLEKPTATSPLEYITQLDELVRAFADILCRRRGLDLSTTALIEEWLIAALTLYLSQSDNPDLTILAHAFGPPDHPEFLRLLARSRNAEVASKFRQIESGAVKRGSFAPAERLIRGVVGSPAFFVRCGASFSLPSFLDNRGILILEGGGSISEDAQRTVFGSVILHNDSLRPHEAQAVPACHPGARRSDERKPDLSERI